MKIHECGVETLTRRSRAAKLAFQRVLEQGGIPSYKRAQEAVQRKTEMRTLALKDVFQEIREAGCTTYQAMADALNEREIATPRGKTWSSSTARKYYLRLQALTENNPTGPP